MLGDEKICCENCGEILVECWPRCVNCEAERQFESEEEKEKMRKMLKASCISIKDDEWLDESVNKMNLKDSECLKNL